MIDASTEDIERVVIIARHGLGHPEVSVRDAAICTLELVATAEAGKLLREHVDSEAWLHEYAQRVAGEIERGEAT